MTARGALTYQDYAALPDDGKRYEIHDGELWEMPGPNLLHQIVLANLFRVIDAHVRARNLGLVLFAPFDVILSDRPTETTILQPDLIYVDDTRREALKMRGLEGSPTLAVEVLSPSTATVDRTRKRALYARYAVPNLWFVDLDEQVIEAQVLHGGAYVIAVAASGSEPVDPPPFTDLGLVPRSLWP